MSAFRGWLFETFWLICLVLGSERREPRREKAKVAA
jgi:hypothetical protein